MEVGTKLVGGKFGKSNLSVGKKFTSQHKNGPWMEPAHSFPGEKADCYSGVPSSK